MKKSRIHTAIEITSWREGSRARVSRGSQTKRPGSLAGLHAARREHLGQFFTPDALSLWMWRMVAPALEGARSEGGRVGVLDNSCGAGALLQFADPAHHVLGGIDIDAECVKALAADARAAGFHCAFSSRGMEHCRPRGYHVALINPPFSVPLSSPNLEAGFATAYGAYGPDTSTTSHAYALQQALSAAQVVAALLPRSYAQRIIDRPQDWPRLAGAFHAPAWCFRDQGAQVQVSVLLFDARPRAPGDIRVAVLDEALSATPDLGLSCKDDADDGPRLEETGLDLAAPTIKRAVTGDARVWVGHNGSKITLGFRCGLTEARVRNAILVARVVSSDRDEHTGPLPRGVRYIGQGALDLEVHLMQEYPKGSLTALLETIRGAGGDPQVDPGLWRHLEKRVRRLAIERTPYRHTALVKSTMSGDAGRFSATARKTHVADRAVWGSPVIKAGETISFERNPDGSGSYQIGAQRFTLCEAELDQRFEVDRGASADQWVTVHEGRLEAFPQIANGLRRRALAQGLDGLLTWRFQLEDLLELSMTGRGIAAWEMGLGKARLAVALVLMSDCKAGLICTESYLVKEMMSELRKLGIDEAQWQVIEKPADVAALRRINIVSYSRLRRPIGGGYKRRTYAHLLRRRVGVLVADEGDLLRNRASQQTAALWQISAKRRFVLSGTPIGNYPRDVFSLMGFSGGDATAQQPYGLRRWHLTAGLRESTARSVRGVDEVRRRFITVEWCTHAWKNDLTAGAKREVPKLRNLREYRGAIAHHIKRRVAHEPDVRRHVAIPTPESIVSEIPWDRAHLQYYLQVAEEFRAWYLKGRDTGRERNLVAILARIQAVQIAANIPQRVKAGSPFLYHGGLTSKQRYACDRLASLSAEGHKTIAFAQWPDLLELIGRELDRRGVEHVIIHGGKQIGERMRELDTRFRFGSAPVLLASTGVGQRGLNLPQADRVLFLTRAWDAKTENQAQGRVLRPQQQRPVVVEHLELAGSIDSYQRQMVAHKQDSASAGLDWATPELESVSFLHLDTILFRFVEALAQRIGCTTHEVRDHLAA